MKRWSLRTQLYSFSSLSLILSQWPPSGCEAGSEGSRTIFINGAEASVAKGPKFRPQNSKGALQKFVRPEKLAAEVSLNMPKRAEKGPNFFEDDVSYKNLKISAEKFTSSSDIFDFSSICQEKLYVKARNISTFEKI
jgi:hypothetical protein